MFTVESAAVDSHEFWVGLVDCGCVFRTVTCHDKMTAQGALHAHFCWGTGVSSMVISEGETVRISWIAEGDGVSFLVAEDTHRPV